MHVQFVTLKTAAKMEMVVIFITIKVQQEAKHPTIFATVCPLIVASYNTILVC